MPNGAEDEEPRRLQVELLGRLLTDAGLLPAAARTQHLDRGQIVDDVAAFRVLGQRRWCMQRSPGCATASHRPN
jgi:hypothetical protein